RQHASSSYRKWAWNQSAPVPRGPTKTIWSKRLKPEIGSDVTKSKMPIKLHGWSMETAQITAREGARQVDLDLTAWAGFQATGSHLLEKSCGAECCKSTDLGMHSLPLDPHSTIC
ncbi:mCG145486, partial [Mus musculus]